MPDAIVGAKATLTTLYVFFAVGKEEIVKSFPYQEKLTAFLRGATPAQRSAWTIVEEGTAIIWPALGQMLTIGQFRKEILRIDKLSAK
jgi:hypothetical protein